jgi:hypothetical protein
LEIEDQDGWVVNTVFEGSLRSLGEFEQQQKATRTFQSKLGG